MVDTAKTSTRARPRGLGTRVLRTAAWLAKARYTHGAAVLVFDHDGAVLLVRQRLRERGRWGMPGGFLIVGEQPAAGACRELHEETGLAVDQDSLEWVADYQQPWAWHWEHLFTVAVERSALDGRRSIEVSALGWFPQEDLPLLTVATAEALHRWRAASPEATRGGR